MAVLGTAILDVLHLQSNYSFANTPDMRRRGQLIRADIPTLLKPSGDRIALEANVERLDLIIEGRDGTGRKSEVPWIRLGSKMRSPSATKGWYIVWLFARDGSGVYLSVAHGSTELREGSLTPRTDEELRNLMAWARELLADKLTRENRFVTRINLRSRTNLALAYEKSCVASFYYPSISIPSDSSILADLNSMARLLGAIYEADRLGQTPISEAPDIRDAKRAVEQVARPTAGPGRQGYGLNAEERRAVELCAMRMATSHLIEHGFSVRDVSGSSSYDLEASRNGELLYIEVKGSTGRLDTVLFTANEISLHRSAYPSNGLIIVHSIALKIVHGTIVGSGGEIEASMPWKVEDERLHPLSYAYSRTSITDESRTLDNT